jgi:hypothetical protein
MLANSQRLPERRGALCLAWLAHPAAKPQSRASVRSCAAVVPLDGGESGGNRGATY